MKIHLNNSSAAHNSSHSGHPDRLQNPREATSQSQYPKCMVTMLQNQWSWETSVICYALSNITDVLFFASNLRWPTSYRILAVIKCHGYLRWTLSLLPLTSLEWSRIGRPSFAVDSHAKRDNKSKDVRHWKFNMDSQNHHISKELPFSKPPLEKYLYKVSGGFLAWQSATFRFQKSSKAARLRKHQVLCSFECFLITFDSQCEGARLGL